LTSTTLNVAGWLVAVASFESRVIDIPPGVACVKIIPLFETAPLTQSCTACVASMMI
jgi:hypothetical protein